MSEFERLLEEIGTVEYRKEVLKTILTISKHFSQFPAISEHFFSIFGALKTIMLLTNEPTDEHTEF